MYVWIWRHLPGGVIGKLAGSLALLVGVLALLFFIVFPWAETRLPFNDVTIDKPASTPSAPSQPAPAHTPSTGQPTPQVTRS
jgi:hypothetical protein